MTEEGLRLLLEHKSPTPYSRALAALRDDTREWWEEDSLGGRRLRPNLNS